ncbi:hypothetical protein M432DRAFT_636920 [Thermoascus aurantiacus ATCC 26904]
MSRPRDRLLFVTNSEYGQTTVMLAVIHELLVRDEFDIHVASHSPLLPRVRELVETHRHAYPRPFVVSSGEEETSTGDDKPKVVFHTISGLSVQELLVRDNLDREMPHPPGVSGAILSYDRIADYNIRYTGPEYMERYHSCVDIIKRVDPVLAIVDPAVNPGLDACLQLGQKHMILSPLPYFVTINSEQPNAAALWKYPALSSGFPYPLPWYLIPANIYLNLRFIWSILNDPRIKAINQARAQEGLKGPIPMFVSYNKDRLYLLPDLPELDYPYHIPDNVIGCGPMVLPSAPLSAVDPELDQWLSRGGPTVVINLGTHFLFDAAQARAIATGLKAVMARKPDLRVLWKLKSKKGDAVITDHEEVLAEEIKAGRARIVPWLKADPIVVLQNENVVCSVHHGGANSFYEACKVGVPHVVLPQWWDTYDFARKAEYLGIGAYGNRSSAPRVEADEFREALEFALSPEAAAKARIIRDICASKKEGRVWACEEITKLARSGGVFGVEKGKLEENGSS